MSKVGDIQYAGLLKCRSIEIQADMVYTYIFSNGPKGCNIKENTQNAQLDG
jgi:hypothetical protein